MDCTDAESGNHTSFLILEESLVVEIDGIKLQSSLNLDFMQLSSSSVNFICVAL